jgi:MYXO-CTERM domain-containing protein
MYSGSITVTGCAKDQNALVAPVAIELDHASAGEFGAFIQSLGDAPLASDGGELFNDLGCGCRVPGTKADARLGWLGVLAGSGLLLRRRNKKR